jgi:hypothetical protein
MSESLPTAESARARLRAAQKSESDALSAVTAALRVRDRARGRLDRAETALGEAQVALVQVSGLARAERLLGEPVGALRQKAREAGLRRSQLG